MFLDEFQKIAQPYEKEMAIEELYEDDDLGLPFKNFRYVIINEAQVTKHTFINFLEVHQDEIIKFKLIKL